MMVNSESNKFDPNSTEHHLEVDDLVKLDAHQTIEELRTENNILKTRLEVLDKHFATNGSVKECQAESNDSSTDSVEIRSKINAERNVSVDPLLLKTKESQVEELLKRKECYKNQTICLKQANDNIVKKYNHEIKYLLSQMTHYVEKLKTSESKLVSAWDQLDKYKSAFEDQQVKTMACFKYLNQIKEKYEDQIYEQGILLKLMNQRMTQLFGQREKSNFTEGKSKVSEKTHKSTKSSCRFSKVLVKNTFDQPEEWSVQEKIEYLELKFINDRRDRILNRLLFENEQLRTMIENDFYQRSENQFKKRIKTNEESYLEYFRRDTIHNRLILCEKKRLNDRRHQADYTEKHNNDDINEEKTDSDQLDENTPEEESENEEEIADDEEGSSSLSERASEDILEEAFTNLTGTSGVLQDSETGNDASFGSIQQIQTKRE